MIPECGSLAVRVPQSVGTDVAIKNPRIIRNILLARVIMTLNVWKRAIVSGMRHIQHRARNFVVINLIDQISLTDK